MNIFCQIYCLSLSLSLARRVRPTSIDYACSPCKAKTTENHRQSSEIVFTSQSGKGSEGGFDASVTVSISIDLRYWNRVIRYRKSEFISDLAARARISSVGMEGMQQMKNPRRLDIDTIVRLIFKLHKVPKPHDPFLSRSIEALLH